MCSDIALKGENSAIFLKEKQTLESSKGIHRGECGFQPY